jgi:hypothetical protein
MDVIANGEPAGIGPGAMFDPPATGPMNSGRSRRLS